MNPKFSTPFLMDFMFERTQYVRFECLDFDEVNKRETPLDLKKANYIGEIVSNNQARHLYKCCKTPTPRPGIGLFPLQYLCMRPRRGAGGGGVEVKTCGESGRKVRECYNGSSLIFVYTCKLSEICSANKRSSNANRRSITKDLE